LNQRFRFIGVNNDIHDVYCKASEVIAGTDIQVLLFSNCLPSTVHPVKILGSEALRKLGFPTGMSQDCLLRRIPLIGSTQGSMGGPPDGPFSKVMPIKEWWDQVNGYYLYVRTPRWANWNTAYGGGDGGHPLYAIINNQLVAVGTPYGGASTPPPGNFYGHFWGNRLTEITNAMHNLSSAHGMPDYHHLPVIDLSAFPDYLPPP
jgi:hypothetical protein